MSRDYEFQTSPAGVELRSALCNMVCLAAMDKTMFKSHERYMQRHDRGRLYCVLDDECKIFDLADDDCVNG